MRKKLDEYVAMTMEQRIEFLEKDRSKIRRENEKLKKENQILKQCLDKLMFDADIVNVQIHLELGDYVYIRSDKQLKLNVKD